MYELINTFTNDTVISRHRTIRAAVLACHKLGKSLGSGSYLPTEIRHADGSPLTDREYDEMCNVDPYNP